MSTVAAVSGLCRLAHDTARLARRHPRMRFARNAMTVVTFSSRPDTNDWIDDVFASIEEILADIAELER
jgi:hypothetical protein